VFMDKPNTGCSPIKKNFAADDPDLLHAIRITGVSVP
jgi:hypothetical protein